MSNKPQTGMIGTVRGRLLRGLGASALGPLVTAIVQIVSVPVFLHFWGAKLYGEWLILSAIPTYLALSDMGFGTASGSDMTMRVAAGDREGALTALQQVQDTLRELVVSMFIHPLFGRAWREAREP